MGKESGYARLVVFLSFLFIDNYSSDLNTAKNSGIILTTIFLSDLMFPFIYTLISLVLTFNYFVLT